MRVAPHVEPARPRIRRRAGTWLIAPLVLAGCISLPARVADELRAPSAGEPDHYRVRCMPAPEGNACVP